MAKTITLSDNDDSELIRADYFGDRAFDVFALGGDDQITMAGSANPILDPFVHHRPA